MSWFCLAYFLSGYVICVLRDYTEVNNYLQYYGLNSYTQKCNLLKVIHNKHLTNLLTRAS